jgi:hypothetical protein
MGLHYYLKSFPKTCQVFEHCILNAGGMMEDLLSKLADMQERVGSIMVRL